MTLRIAISTLLAVVGCSAGTAPDTGTPTAPDSGPIGRDAGPSISTAQLPLIAPLVRSATPPGLLPRGARQRAMAAEPMLAAAELRDRFFSGSGPTDLMNLLEEIDRRLTEVNSGSPGASCLTQAPVGYTITPAGHDVELVAQCYRQLAPSTPGDVAFLQFGQRDGTTSLYIAIGAARLAARISPLDSSTDHVVDAWYGVGYTNASGCGTTGTFDDCSYALTELHANPVTKVFEMAVAGIGVGFCGVQFASDGMQLRGVGSTDMGSQCNVRATLCVSAIDLDTTADCTTADPYMLPPIGRHAGAGAHEFGVSNYPDEPNVTLDGTTSDSLYFGPQSPTAGAGDFDAGH